MREQGAKRHNDGWKGIGVTIVILAICDRDWSDVSLPEVYRSKYIDCICARGYDHCRDHGQAECGVCFPPFAVFCFLIFCIRSRDFHSLHMIPDIRLRL